MNAARDRNPNDVHWSTLTQHLEYKVRVRGAVAPFVFLWGSNGITKNSAFQTPLVLHIRNDVFGAEISVGTQVAGGNQTVLGKLEPGETFSIQIQDIVGVFASCELESTVHCVIKSN
jgi:hypothetical protein